MVVSPRSALSSWTTPRVLSSVTSRAQVCDAIDLRFEIFVGSRSRWHRFFHENTTTAEISRMRIEISGEFDVERDNKIGRNAETILDSTTTRT